MNANDLLEHRAERGTPRGPAQVWAAAESAARPRASRSQAPRSRPALRVALAVWLAGLVALGAFGVSRNGDQTEAKVAAQPEPSEADQASGEPLPAPILVEGMQLRSAIPPAHPGLDGSDIFSRTPLRSYPATPQAGSDRHHVRTTIYADPEQPYDNPILGLNQFPDGGFRPWVVNTPAGMDDDDRSAFLDDLVRDLERGDDEWTLPSSSGLEELARVDVQRDGWLRTGWQFDFVEEGPEKVVLQAETTLPDRPGEVSEWIWLARWMQDASDEDYSVRPTEVLGGPGLVFTLPGNGAEEVTWSRDGFAYRLGVSEVQGDREVAGRAADAIPRLSTVPRGKWIDAVEEANGFGSVVVGSGLARWLRLAVLAIWVVSLVVFVVRRSYVPAVTLITAPVIALTFGSSSNANLIVVLAVVAFIGAWWVHRRSARERPVDTAEPPQREHVGQGVEHKNPGN